MDTKNNNLEDYIDWSDAGVDVSSAKAIKENLGPQVSLDDGLKAVAIGQAAELSIIEKRIVKLNEILKG